MPAHLEIGQELLSNVRGGLAAPPSTFVNIDIAGGPPRMPAQPAVAAAPVAPPAIPLPPIMMAGSFGGGFHMNGGGGFRFG